MPKVIVSFVVLNWNGLDDTLKCLESIRRQTLKSTEIIVVDNGSSDEQKSELRKINDITLVDLPRNFGFTGGQLAGYKKASGQFIALINNDAVIARDWAQLGVETLRKHKRAAAVGGRAYQWDPAKKQKAYDTSSRYYSYQVVNLISGHTRTLSYGDRLCAVNSISGAGVLIRRSAVGDEGYFDSRFFAYYEETDLFARLKRLGWDILYEPRMHSWHQIAKSTRSKPSFYLYYMHRNRFRFAVRNFDRPYLRKFLFRYTEEFIKASLRISRSGTGNSLEEYNLVKAYLWNLVHFPLTLWSRRQIQQLGGEYSLRLLNDKAESIGVVITCYNYAQYVTEAIESVLNQTLPADEIIVINDGSSDDSLSVIQKYKDKVKIIDQPNLGVITSKNIGLKKLSTDWIVYLDADDKLDKQYLKTAYAEARSYNADLVYCGMRFFGYDQGTFESRPFTSRSLRRGNYINNSALMRRQILLDLGGYKQQMDFGFEDWELYLALAEKGARFHYLNQPLLYYRRHGKSSRDRAAQAKLEHAHATVRHLHPKMFSLKYWLKDVAHDILTIHQRRTPLQVVQDYKYLSVKKLDDMSVERRWLNKLLGFGRLLGSGNIDIIIEKIKLNARRLWMR